MAVNREYAGRVFPESAPYEVSRVKIAEFAAAIGDDDPVYSSAPAARAAGFADVIAPPTFAFVISYAAAGAVLADPGLGLDFSMVVHGAQQFRYSRPLQAGDVVTARPSITAIRDVGRAVALTTSTEISTLAGEHVCTAETMFIERAAA